jgi:hypothetical protein
MFADGRHGLLLKVTGIDGVMNRAFPRELPGDRLTT